MGVRGTGTSGRKGGGESGSGRVRGGVKVKGRSVRRQRSGTKDMVYTAAH